MDRAKSYLWLLTVIMGLAITTAVKDFVVLLTAPATTPSSYWPTAVRFAIFLILSIRWTLGTLWYFDRAYISNPGVHVLPASYFFDFVVAFVNFLLFVALAVAVTAAPTLGSYLSDVLNNTLVGGKQVAPFVWVLALLLSYDSIWFVLMVIWWWKCGGEKPRRVHVFWTTINSFTFLLCGFIFLLYGWQGKALQDAELPMLFVILVASSLDFWGTVVEVSPLSQWLSPSLPET